MRKTHERGLVNAQLQVFVEKCMEKEKLYQEEIRQLRERIQELKQTINGKYVLVLLPKRAQCNMCFTFALLKNEISLFFSSG